MSERLQRGLYAHRMGGIYNVRAVGLDKTKGGAVVIYQDSSDRWYTRSEEEFFEKFRKIEP